MSLEQKHYEKPAQNLDMGLLEKIQAIFWTNKDRLVQYNRWLPEVRKAVDESLDEIEFSNNALKLTERNKKTLISFLSRCDWASELMRLIDSRDWNLNVFDSKWKTALIYACENWLDAFVIYILHFRWVRDKYAGWKPAVDWTMGWSWSPDTKKKIVWLLNTHFRVN